MSDEKRPPKEPPPSRGQDVEEGKGNKGGGPIG
jgi:hypothetical protein